MNSKQPTVLMDSSHKSFINNNCCAFKHHLRASNLCLNHLNKYVLCIIYTYLNIFNSCGRKPCNEQQELCMLFIVF